MYFFLPHGHFVDFTYITCSIWTINPSFINVYLKLHKKTTLINKSVSNENEICNKKKKNEIDDSLIRIIIFPWYEKTWCE